MHGGAYERTRFCAFLQSDKNCLLHCYCVSLWTLFPTTLPTWETVRAKAACVKASLHHSEYFIPIFGGLRSKWWKLTCSLTTHNFATCLRSCRTLTHACTHLLTELDFIILSHCTYPGLLNWSLETRSCVFEAPGSWQGLFWAGVQAGFQPQQRVQNQENKAKAQSQELGNNYVEISYF